MEKCNNPNCVICGDAVMKEVQKSINHFENEGGLIPEDKVTDEKSIDDEERHEKAFVDMILSQGASVKVDRKDVKGKHSPLLLPIEADVAFSNVSDHGLAKYQNRDTWMYEDPEKGVYKYLDACIRHAKAHIQKGEIDPESGLPHVWPVLWNAAVSCWHYARLVEKRNKK